LWILETKFVKLNGPPLWQLMNSASGNLLKPPPLVHIAGLKTLIVKFVGLPTAVYKLCIGELVQTTTALVHIAGLD
jgi:hypothetical protein